MKDDPQRDIDIHNQCVLDEKLDQMAALERPCPTCEFHVKGSCSKWFCVKEGT
jgi:hypothetical protein